MGHGIVRWAKEAQNKNTNKKQKKQTHKKNSPIHEIGLVRLIVDFFVMLVLCWCCLISSVCLVSLVMLVLLGVLAMLCTPPYDSGLFFLWGSGDSILRLGPWFRKAGRDITEEEGGENLLRLVITASHPSKLLQFTRHNSPFGISNRVCLWLAAASEACHKVMC